jgi:hypothetical protein
LNFPIKCINNNTIKKIKKNQNDYNIFISVLSLGRIYNLIKYKQVVASFIFSNQMNKLNKQYREILIPLNYLFENISLLHEIIISLNDMEKYFHEDLEFISIRKEIVSEYNRSNLSQISAHIRNKSTYHLDRNNLLESLNFFQDGRDFEFKFCNIKDGYENNHYYLSDILGMTYIIDEFSKTPDHLDEEIKFVTEISKSVYEHLEDIKNFSQVICDRYYEKLISKYT